MLKLQKIELNRRLSNKMSKLKTLMLITLGMILAIILFTLGAKALIWHDCYDSHLRQCTYAHSLNKTYSYCSGFLGEPEYGDFELFCAFHPEEGCGEIPHGCVLIDNEVLEGFRIPFTKLEWRF